VIDFIKQKAMNGSNMDIKQRDSTRLTDLDFADGLSLLAQSRDTLQKITINLKSEAGKAGLRISAEKTKVRQICGKQSTDQIIVGGMWLGSHILAAY